MSERFFRFIGEGVNDQLRTTQLPPEAVLKNGQIDSTAGQPEEVSPAISTAKPAVPIAIDRLRQNF